MLDTTPTWGYRPDGSAQIFNLASGEGLPDGWQGSPACITDPDLATADALSAAAEGRPYDVPAFDAVSGFRVDRTEDGAPNGAAGEDLAGALAEIARLQGIIDAGMKENEDLIAEVTKAEALLEAAAAEVATLKAALDKALSDGADAANARNEANATADRLSAELADAHKALDAATAPKALIKAK